MSWEIGRHVIDTGTTLMSQNTELETHSLWPQLEDIAYQ